MTDRELMQMALGALEGVPIEYDFHGNPMDEDAKKVEPAIKALRDRLAQSEPDAVLDNREQAQELRELADRFSEGWHDGIKIDASDIMLLSQAASIIESYTAPPKREWVGLTDEERTLVIHEWRHQEGKPWQLCELNEAKLREKNDF